MFNRVIIAGAGISGLAAGLAFRKAGWEVTVVEQSQSFVKTGAGILLQANGLIALDALGIGDEVRAKGSPVRYFQMKSRRGWTYFRNDFELELPARLLLLSIRRAELHGLLEKACRSAGVDIKLGVKVVGVMPSSVGPCVLECEANGEEVSFHANLVIGADGVRSKIRTQSGIISYPQPFIEGSIHGVVPFSLDSSDHGAYFGRGEGGGLFPLADGSTFWFWGRPDDSVIRIKESSFMKWREEVVKTFPPMQKVLQHCRDWSETSLYIHKSIKCDQWSIDNVVLIGDAAHAMSPSVGQGANSALVDALTLACCAASAKNNKELISELHEFELKRRPIVEVFQRAGENGGVFGSSRKKTNEIIIKAALLATRFTSLKKRKSIIRGIAGLEGSGFDVKSIGIDISLPF